MRGLETCPLRTLDNNSLDFVANRFFMKLFEPKQRYCQSLSHAI